MRTVCRSSAIDRLALRLYCFPGLFGSLTMGIVIPEVNPFHSPARK